MNGGNKLRLTNLSLMTATACLLLGVIFGLMNAPFCWSCLSADKVEETHFNDTYVPGKSFLCNRCDRRWMAQTPWVEGLISKDDSFWTTEPPKPPCGVFPLK